MSKHILIVDDEDVVRKTLRDILITLGYQVTLAPDGQQAQNALEHQTFDLILCDIIMPNMDGLSFLRCLQTNNIDIPIIMLLGAPDEDVKQRAQNLGASATMHKPVKIMDLKAIIEQYA